MAKRSKATDVQRTNRKNEARTKKSLNELYTLDVYHTKKVLLPDLAEMRAQLAKNTNQRLRELEAAGLDFYAYDKVADYLRTHRPEADKVRFSQSKNYLSGKESEAALKAEISTLQSFLTSESSTVSGQKRIEARRIATFGNWKPKGARGSFKGIDLSREASTKQFYRFLNSQTFKNLRKVFSSEQIFRAYKEGSVDGSRNQRKIQKAMQDYIESSEVKSIKGLFEKVNANPIPNSSNIG